MKSPTLAAALPQVKSHHRQPHSTTRRTFKRHQGFLGAMSRVLPEHQSDLLQLKPWSCVFSSCGAIACLIACMPALSTQTGFSHVPTHAHAWGREKSQFGMRMHVHACMRACVHVWTCSNPCMQYKQMVISKCGKRSTKIVVFIAHPNSPCRS